MQSLNINTAKIDKSALYEGKQGKYLSLTLMENRDGPDQYGNDGFIVQDIGKERREAGEKGPIVGNWKHVGKGRDRTAQEAQRRTQGQQRTNSNSSQQEQNWDDDSDSIPF